MCSASTPCERSNRIAPAGLPLQMKAVVPVLVLAFLLWKVFDEFPAPGAPLLAVLLGYLSGSIPFGYLLGRRKGADLLRQGSGNIGASNTLRILGRKAGVVVLLMDAIKGTLPCALAPLLILRLLPDAGPAGMLALLAGIAAVLGHNHPCWLGFRGGKGIATSAGILLWLSPAGLLLPLAGFLVMVFATRLVSLGSLTAATLLTPGLWLAGGDSALTEAGLVIGLMAILRHHANIRRLWEGREPRLGEKLPS